MSEAKDVKPASPLERLHYFCQKGDQASAMDAYSKDSKLLTTPGNLGNTAVHWAAHAGHARLVETLLFEAPDIVDVQNDTGDTPLHLASWNGHADAVSTLLRFHAKDSIKNQAGKYASDLARADAVKCAFSNSASSRRSIAFAQEESDSE